MTQISGRLSVEGPDSDGDYELTLSADSDQDYRFHYINRAQADALIAALSVRDASGRLIAPPQTEPPARPDGPWDSNGK